MTGDHDVFLVDGDGAGRAMLQSMAPTARSVESIEALTAEMQGPSVVVFGPSFADDEGLNAATGVLSSSSVGAVLIADTLTTSVLQSALRAGFRDVLAQPVDQAQLEASIGRVSATLPAVGSIVPTATSEADPDRGRVITIFSTKGGAGKSMLATNVACALAQRESRPVVLVDADLQFGDVCVMLKLAPRHTVVDAVAAGDRLDAGYLEELLVTHPSTGLRVLSAPLEPAIADQVSNEGMMKIISLLRDMAAYVVVDTPAYFNDVVLGLIEESDDVLLMAGMDIPNIKNVRIGLQTLRLLNTPMSKIHLVLNRSNSKVKLDISEVERTLQVKADTRIPSDVAVPQSVNKGVPIIIDAPKSGPAKAIEALVRQLIEENAKR